MDEIVKGLPVSKRFKVTRRVQDPRIGDLGNTTFSITALTGPNALSLADIRVHELNTQFQHDLAKYGIQSWWQDRGGWKDPVETLRRLKLNNNRHNVA